MSRRATIPKLVEQAPDTANQAAFIGWARQFTDERRIKVRLEAEERARELLTAKAGEMAEEDVRQLGALINTDYHNGRDYKTRFSPAFHGASIDRLVLSLDALNLFLKRIWEAASDEDALDVANDVIVDKRVLPGAGRSLPSMLMYLRDPEKYSPWMNYTHRGLRALTGFRATRSSGSEGYRAFCEEVVALRRTYDIPPQEVDVILAWAGKVSVKRPASRSRMVIPDADVARFKEKISSGEYAETERNYKVATHRVMRRLLSPEVLRSGSFGSLLAETVHSNYPDLGRLGFDEDEASEIRSAIQSSSFTGIRQALLNLSGGRFGFAQWFWMPKAVELGLELEIVQAFEELLDDKTDLAERVDRFRERLVEIQVELRDRGGFESNWTVLNISLNFIASILGAYDPRRYTFYAATKLQKALEDFGVPWPNGTNGERYAQVCALVTEVSNELASRGVPISDLIDAQSFMYTRAESEPDEPEAPATSATPVDPVAVGSELATRVSWDEARAVNLVELTMRSRQLLFYGPPGTGKTYVAKELANLVTGEGEARVELVQFHPSYSYEDFVEGIRPRLTNDEKQLSYEMRKGVLRRLIDRAVEYADDQFFLIIDEINRANLPRVFGELLYGLEYRGRSNPIILPYSDTELYVPDNLRFIGTMNTADRSIALVDTALRRRFKHVHFPPDSDALAKWLSDHSSEELAQEAAARLEALNERVVDLLGKDRLVGHSFLMRTDLEEVGFETVWEEDLAPVLTEHLFNRVSEVATLRAAFLAQP